jgi:mRNA interferase MazF
VKRGELYRIANSSTREPKRARIFVVVSRQALIDSRFATVICAPVYPSYEGLATQVLLGDADGLEQGRSIHCDELVSIPNPALTALVGKLSSQTLKSLDLALRIALDISD